MILETSARFEFEVAICAVSVVGTVAEMSRVSLNRPVANRSGRIRKISRVRTF